MKLEITTQDNLPQIKEWIAADPWHKDNPAIADLLLTGGGLLSFHLADDEGPICYTRLDAEGDMVRFATQFGPEEQVSKRRLVTGLLQVGIPAIIKFAKERNFKGLIFRSESPTLIAFMKKQKFESAGEDNYQLIFEESYG